MKTSENLSGGEDHRGSGYKGKFRAAAKILEDRWGATVISPAVLPEGLTPRDYMEICFSMIDCADKVVFLEDWQESQGAKLEREYCKYIRKPMAYMGQYRE